jgi:hypothetical protein
MFAVLLGPLTFHRWLLVASLGATLWGCGSLDERYAGFLVVDKQANQETERIAVRVTSCVTPNNEVICERRYGAFDECSLRCKTPPNRWIERPAGYGGYENRPVTRYFLILRSPSGSVQRVETSQGQFESAVIGQVLGRSPQSAPSATNQTPRSPDSSSQTPSSATTPAPASTEERPAPRTAPPTSSDMSMAEAQRRLARLGFDPGPPDGLLGPRTTAALRAFQRSAGLNVTGLLDEATRAELSKR